MPTVVTGLRGAPSNLRAVGAPKQPYFRLKGSIFGIKPEILLGLDRAIACFFKQGFPTILTSGVRAINFDRDFSLHPFGYAVDLLSDRVLTDETWKSLEEDVRRELGHQYDILVHDAGSGMHMHIEYDDKTQKDFQLWKATARKDHVNQFRRRRDEKENL